MSSQAVTRGATRAERKLERKSEHTIQRYGHLTRFGLQSALWVGLRSAYPDPGQGNPILAISADAATIALVIILAVLAKGYLEGIAWRIAHNAYSGAFALGFMLFGIVAASAIATDLQGAWNYFQMATSPFN